MTLLHVLSLAIPPQISRSCGVGVEYEFAIRFTIPGDESGLNLRANIFVASDDFDVLHDNQLKNNHPLGVTFMILYGVELRCEG